ncbi:MAG: hypothetical protein ABDH49_03870 [Candidatus Hydrothermales bacterium]
MVFIFLIPLSVNFLNFPFAEIEKKLKSVYDKDFNKNFIGYKKNSYPLTYIGPQGGTIIYPISSEINPKKVVVRSFVEYHKCENVFRGDTFEIALPYSSSYFTLVGRIGVMTGNNKFLLLRDPTSYYITSDNFVTVDTVYLNAMIGGLDAQEQTCYMVISDSLFRSIDGGSNFVFVSDLESYIPSGSYICVIDIYPFNSNIVAILAFYEGGSNYYFLYSTNGGLSFSVVSTIQNVSGYCFSLRFSHTNPNVLFFTSESGLFYTTNSGSTWSQVQMLPGLQYYPGFVFDVVPFNQDSFLIASIVDRGIFKARRVYGNVYNYSILDTTFIPFYFEPIYRSLNLIDTFYVGSNDGIYYTVNRGRNWTRYKNRLKAVIFFGPEQASSKRDTLFLITEGGLVYRSFDIINQGFTELPFKGNLIFFGNNLVENFISSAKSLYLLTRNIRLLVSPNERILFFSNNAGSSFALRNSASNLANYSGMFMGSNVNTLYLWNDVSILKSTDGGSSFASFYSGSIRSATGEFDTLFVLRGDGTLLGSFGGSSFTNLAYIPNGGDIFYIRSLPYVFFDDMVGHHVLYYNILQSRIDTAIKRPNSNSYFISLSPSYDGVIYALYYDAALNENILYYKVMPNGNLKSVSVPLDNPVGIHALNNGYVVIYELGRGLYLMGVTAVAEEIRDNLEFLFVPSLIYDFLEVKGIKSPIRYTIYSVLGRKLGQGLLSGKVETKINLNNLKSGVYHINIDKKIFRFIKF